MRAFGDGATIVRVRAEYDVAQTSERDVRRAPDRRSRRSSAVRRSESYDGGGKRYRQPRRGRRSRQRNARARLAQSPPGAIKRLSTAVFVDRDRALDLAKVRELAAATVGYDARRGDTLAVEAVDFHRDSRRAQGRLVAALRRDRPARAGAHLDDRARRLRAACAAAARRARAVVDRSARASSAHRRPPRVFRRPACVRMLEQEPPHAAAAIISALPAATATAVLELYPPHEREAIVSRMQRRHSPLLDDAHELLRRHV